MTQKKICLLGFSADAENKIKEILHKYSGTLSFTWVSANDKTLDGVVINASFLEVPQIQKYISLINKPIVCAHGSNDGEELAQRYKLHSLSLLNTKNIETWMKNLLGKESEVSVDLLSSETLKQSVIDSRTHSHSTSKVESVKNKEDFLHKIRQKAPGVFRATYKDSVTWLKPSEGLVYINFPRENVPGYDQWLWEEVSETDIPDYIRQLKLDLWLFESIWRSNLDSSSYINQNQYYRLMRWPQPLSRNGRTEALRLAAIAQANPINFSILQKKTGYSAETVLRFIFATLYAGQLKEVVDYVEQPEETVIISATEQKKREEKRSLLQRFRAKLGL